MVEEKIIKEIFGNINCIYKNQENLLKQQKILDENQKKLFRDLQKLEEVNIRNLEKLKKYINFKLNSGG